MERKNIYLIQVAETFRGDTVSAYLPYAVGTIAAKAWSNKTVSDTFCLKRLVFLREPPERLADSLETPFLVGFSCYIWNTEYNKAAARTIKERSPKCIVVFGGHHVPPDTSMLEDCDAVDVLVHGEGEEVFEQLLCAYARGTPLSDIPNISYKLSDGMPTQTRCRPITGTDYPSPYTQGVFDSLIRTHPHMQFSAILETNRGCPNQCAFCDWGPLKSRVRLFPIERVQADIAWFSANKIEYLWGADANFGQFNRDLQIADLLIDAKNNTGYPSRMKVNYAKNNSSNVFELAKRFAEADISKSTTISFQTLSDDALRNVGRKNMNMESFSGLLHLYRCANIPTYSEVILALPGETYDSFVRGLGRLIESGQHTFIEIYDCVLLPNSLLAQKEYRQEFGIKTVRVPYYQYHSEETTDDIVEYSDVIVSTKSLSENDWIRCKAYAVTIQCMHGLGLLSHFAIYLYNEKQISYSDFYCGLIDFFSSSPDTLANRVLSEQYERLAMMFQGKNMQYYFDMRYGNVKWCLDEGAFLLFTSEVDRFYNEVYNYLRSYSIEDEVFEQLLLYQKSVVCTPDDKPLTFITEYDFFSYMRDSISNDYSPLRKVKTTITISPKNYSTLAEYAREVVWYGRRHGKTLYTNQPECLTVRYTD